jgi:hypothetical protein
MAFDNIDAPGAHNRHNRRAVAAIQRKAGAEGRIAAAQTKRQRKMARSFEQTLNRTINFYWLPETGLTVHEADGAYLSIPRPGGRHQVIVVGDLKASIDHYIAAVGVFLKKKFKLVGENDMGDVYGRSYHSIILEPADEA